MQAFPFCAHRHKRRSRQWRHKHSKIRDPTPIPTTLCASNAGRHIPGLPYISDECRQDGQRWHSIRSVFTKEGVNVFKEEDVLITCKGEPILIGVRDSHGRYQIPLMQQRGQWQPRRPSKQARKALRQANSVYNLPSTKQAIKWMHAVCGYPVKSTWLKAIKAGNYVGWPMLTERNVQKYYPETTETAKGHLNQTRKNVRSTKAKPMPLETCDTLLMVK